LFNPLMVAKLQEKCTRLFHAHLSFRDNMSFVGILSTQLLADQYVHNFRSTRALTRDEYRTWLDESSTPTSADLSAPRPGR
jgi:hypothetical protein